MQPQIKKQSSQIPVGALDSKIFQDDQSSIFNVDHSKEVKLQDLHLFNKNTQIVKPGEKRNVVVGLLEQKKKTFMEILAPYLQATGSYTATAGKTAYSWIANGLWWAYDKMKNNIVPYAVNEIPKYLFIVSDKKNKKNITQSSQEIIVVGLDDQQYQRMNNQIKKKKITVIIPLGQKDEQFNDFLKKEGFVENSNMFSLGQQSQQLSEGIMIPYESFETAYIEMKKQGKDMRKEEKVISKIGDAIAISISKQYSVLQYPMLDILQENEHSQTGYIVIPEQVLKKQSNRSSYSGDFPLQKVQETKNIQQNVQRTEVFELNQQQQDNKQQQQQQQIETAQKPIEIESIPVIVQPTKVVDNQRKVRVEIPKQTNKNIEERQVFYA